MASHIAVLPTELFLDVIEELPLAAVWGLRRVSQPFHRFLTDPEVVNKAFRRHQIHDVTDGITGDPLQLLQAHHRGVPLAYAHVGDLARHGKISLDPRPILKGKYLLATTENRRLVLVDLETGFARSWPASGVYIIALTSRSAVWAVDKKVHWQSLGTKKESFMEMEEFVRAIAGHGHFLAIYHGKDNPKVTLTNVETMEVIRQVNYACGSSKPCALSLDNNYCLIVEVQDLQRPLGLAITQVDVSTGDRKMYVVGVSSEIDSMWSPVLEPSGRVGEWAIKSDMESRSVRGLKSHGVLGILRPGEDHQWTPLSSAATSSIYWKGMVYTHPETDYSDLGMNHRWNILNTGGNGLLALQSKGACNRGLARMIDCQCDECVSGCQCDEHPEHLHLINESFLISMTDGHEAAELTIFSFHDCSGNERFTPLPLVEKLPDNDEGSGQVCRARAI